MEIKTIYEDKDVLVVDKPAGIITCHETWSIKPKTETLIDELIKEKPELAESGTPPRYGVVHRLDKDTSGVLLVAKNTEALKFLQKQFSALEKTLEKRYITLVEGNMNSNSGTINALIARAKNDPRKQKVYSTINAPKSAREAITEYKVLKRYAESPTSLKLRGATKVNEFTLAEVKIKTGRRHQIRCHLSYLKHPVAGDKMYGFSARGGSALGGKNSKMPEGLTRQFLHSAYLKIQLPSGQVKEFQSNLPEELDKILKNLEESSILKSESRIE